MLTCASLLYLLTCTPQRPSNMLIVSVCLLPRILLTVAVNVTHSVMLVLALSLKVLLASPNVLLLSLFAAITDNN